MMIRHPFVVLVVAFSINRIVDSVDWVDIDTPPDMHTITSLIDGTIYSLVSTMNLLNSSVADVRSLTLTFAALWISFLGHVR